MEQGKRYKVTGWCGTSARLVMTVWVEEVTDEHIKGHLRTSFDPFVRISTWSRALADSWTWTEIERGNQ